MAKEDSVKAAIETIDTNVYEISVPVYIVLWGVTSEGGVDPGTATQIAEMAAFKIFPSPED